MYNAKVRCIEGNMAFYLGGIYEVREGWIKDSVGGSWGVGAFMSIEHLNETLLAQFEEVK